MEATLRTYKVKENDTINEVAKKHGLEIKELIAYHNKRAEPHQQIRNRIPDFLQEIILPPEGYILKNGKEVWENKAQPEPNNINKTFTGKLYSQYYKKNLCYGVLKTIKNGDKITTIAYQTSVRFYPKDDTGSNYVSVDITSKTFINNEEPNLIIEELALSCIEVLYPITFKIDKNCKLVDIQNHTEILNRWKKQKANKLKYYEGKTAENYFVQFEKTLLDKALCLHYLKNDWFFNLYFNNIYSTYASEKNRKANITTFPIIPNTTSVEYTVKQGAKISEKNNRITIDIKGICTDKRTITELESKLFFPSLMSARPSIIGEYRTRYFLKPNNHKIQSAFLECNVELSKPKYISISISEIDNATEKIAKRNPESIKNQNENKKSFWKNLFS